jgi:hypothetical protein
MKGKQIPITLYVSPQQYWLLKSISHRSGFPMQFLLRRALSNILADMHRLSGPGRGRVSDV